MLEVQSTEGSKGTSSSAYLVFVNPQDQKETSKELKNDSQFLIGRSVNCNVTVGNPIVSRKHCSIKYDENGKWTITDNSLTGTYVNKKRIEHSSIPVALHDEDMITLTGPYSYPFYFFIGNYADYTKRNVGSAKRKNCVADPGADSPSIKRSNRNESEINVAKDDSVALIESPTAAAPLITVQNINKFSKKSVPEVASVSGTNSNANLLNENENYKTDDDNSDDIITQLCCKRSVPAPAPAPAPLLPSTPPSGSLESNSTTNVDLQHFKKELLEKDKELEHLRLEVRVMECRSELTDSIMDGLKQELKELKSSLVSRERELKHEINDLKNVLINKELELQDIENKLQQSKVSEDRNEQLKNEITLKMKEDFIQMLEVELICSICNEIILEATALNCSHMFCNFCIHTWLKRKKECAICRAPVTQIVKSRSIDLFIDKILEYFFSNDILLHRKAILEERKLAGNQPERVARGQRMGRGRPRIRNQAHMDNRTANINVGLVGLNLSVMFDDAQLNNPGGAMEINVLGNIIADETHHNRPAPYPAPAGRRRPQRNARLNNSADVIEILDSPERV